MTGTTSNVISLWPEPEQSLTVELDPASTREQALVHVAGELDLATAPLLLAELTTLADSATGHVDLDLLHVRFCDGSGLAVLLEGRRRIGERGGTITLHDPCRSLQRILDICGLTLDLEPRQAPEPDATTSTARLTLLPPLRQN